MSPQELSDQFGGVLVDAAFDLFEEDGRHIARWPQLSLSAHGSTRQDAIQNLVQMILAAFAVSVQRGDLKQMLAKGGIEVKPLLPGQKTPEKISSLPYLVIHTDAGTRSAA
jgi:hypothetical protein